MKLNDILIRTDGKQFTVTNVNHWSTIQSTDGEIDRVKYYGDDKDSELYCSFSNGYGYKKMNSTR